MRLVRVVNPIVNIMVMFMDLCLSIVSKGRDKGMGLTEHGVDL
jgi:hypothetical protein